MKKLSRKESLLNTKLMQLEKLTPQEEMAMKQLWKLGDGTVKEFQAGYEEPVPPYTTLASVVKNLERKGYVKARRVGNTYLYSPQVSIDEYKSTSLGRMVQSYFRNSYKELVSFFAREQNISAEELREVIRMIEDGGETPEATNKEKNTPTR